MNVFAASESADLTPLWVFLGFLTVCLLVRLASGAFDGWRLERYFREQDLKLISKKWAPWDRRCVAGSIYKVVYQDPEYAIHRAYAKTSAREDVYLNDDKIIEQPPQPSIEEEKAALRKRLAELEEMDA